MAGRIDARLKELGIVLPKPAAVQGAYVPWVKSATFLFVSGQITMGPNGLEYVGTLGLDMNVEFGRKAARLAAINVLAQAADALDGDLDRVTRVVKVTGFVAATRTSSSIPRSSTGPPSSSSRCSASWAGMRAPPSVAPRCREDRRVEVEAIFEFG